MADFHHWLLMHPRADKAVIASVLVGLALFYAGLCYGAWWHNQRVQAECASRRCPEGLSGKHVEGAGCLCVTLPLP